jgi:prepilin-type N-terminal cleavage/methylation domain-containing protein
MFYNNLSQNNPPGFPRALTLIEILVVITIISILATLIIPNILRSRINSNEIAAISNLNTLGKSVQQYYMSNSYKYPASLDDLTLPASDPPYITKEMASGSFSGYQYEYIRVDDDRFYIKAKPKTPGKTGTRYFYLDETGVIRQNTQQEATVNDQPVQ